MPDDDSGPDQPRPMARVSWDTLFSDTDYRHHLKLARGEAHAFFAPWDPSGDVVSQRRHWVSREPARHELAVPAAEPVLRETAAWLRLGPAPLPDTTDLDAAALLRALSVHVEADMIWLLPQGEPPKPRMVAGSVCFPSSWAPETKLGLTLAAIHGVVPGLNEALESPLDTFLARLRPGPAWLRANWGLSASPERNQHPLRGLPRLQATVDADQIWVRVEQQALVALPETGGILFGIRIEQQTLREFCGNRAWAAGLQRALASMPEAMARYKGLSAAREPLLAFLRGMGPATDVRRFTD